MDKIYTIRYKNMLNELKISQSELINILFIFNENSYRSLEDVNIKLSISNISTICKIVGGVNWNYTMILYKKNYIMNIDDMIRKYDDYPNNGLDALDEIDCYIIRKLNS